TNASPEVSSSKARFSADPSSAEELNAVEAGASAAGAVTTRGTGRLTRYAAASAALSAREATSMRDRNFTVEGGRGTRGHRRAVCDPTFFRCRSGGRRVPVSLLQSCFPFQSPMFAFGAWWTRRALGTTEASAEPSARARFL